MNTEEIKNEYVEEGAVFLCDECGAQINEDDKICSNCGNPLHFYEESSSDEINENIAVIKWAAKIVKIIFIILAALLFILAIISLFNAGYSDDYFGLFLICGVAGGVLLALSHIMEAFVKWKAYMLETNYNILKNVERDKNGSN